VAVLPAPTRIAARNAHSLIARPEDSRATNRRAPRTATGRSDRRDNHYIGNGGDANGSL